ncbi:MAG TPA: amidohydrolase family protein [Mycobacteriales bacterium]|nr:amidohydrolase family protein [Mycobacteriales bacterium]
MPSSLVIRGGTVYDGTGSPARVSDVIIDDDRVVAVQDAPDGIDAEVLDVTGLAVAPGFINVLSHAWGSLQSLPCGPSDLRQGVTTEVFGEGFSPGPSVAEFTELMRQFGIGPDQRADFPRLSEGLGFLAASGVAPNVASFVGGMNLRVIGAGLSDAPLTASALDRVRSVLDEEMVDGALGVGTALIYAPGTFADTDELVAVSEVIARHDGLYISHLRSEGDRFLECLDELLEIGQRAAVRTEVYHLKAAGRQNWPKMKLAIERIEAARDAGQPVGANMYPYTAGGTALAAAIPPSYHAGGPAALAERLSNPAERAAMAADMAQASVGWENLYLAAGGGSGIFVIGGSAAGSKSGRWLSEIADAAGEAEIETLLDLVADDPTLGALYFIVDEDNIGLGLQQPWVSIGSDAEALAVEAPWTDHPTHPRTYGTFARFLGRYSRELGLIPLTEAIRRMTSLPADTLRLRDRGRLVPGNFADVVVFDPATITDSATYEQPHAYATGVHHVVVNGRPVVVDASITGALPGRHLRRGV